ncbi:hypothetical protein [Nostoc sp.]|uniref:hypothetical protein n=1 Tax=Nostoc sp. TaxID=1180 RepID=UPI003FA57D25
MSETPLRLDIRSDEFTSLVEMADIFPQCFYNAEDIHLYYFDVGIFFTYLCTN